MVKRIIRNWLVILLGHVNRYKGGIKLIRRLFFKKWTCIHICYQPFYGHKKSINGFQIAEMHNPLGREE